MKIKLNLSLLVTGMMLAMANCAIAADSTEAAASSPQAVQAITPDSAHQVIAYYFHGTRRCSNCIKIEKYTHEAIDSAFSDALKDGHLVWRVLNTDEDSNAHFVDDYQLYTKSVVLVDLHHGKQVRWKNLEKVWEHLDDESAFKQYIRDEAALFLKID
ncbi:Redox-active disulfide protein 2 [Candidatus Zixiibacteriota bacterium]|nr:Redox-active disulfide protein 2 [candidate division Zixibacteria bacterium]